MDKKEHHLTKSHCHRGHELSKVNRNGEGSCRKCKSIRSLDYYYRNKERVLERMRIKREDNERKNDEYKLS